jgi:type IV pilus assembly protein PilV
MHHRRFHTQRGFGLFDALISLAILSFGMLAMTRFQTRMVAQTTEAQSRQIATQLAAEHMGTVLVDVDNAACYTVPFSGTCSNTGAKTRTAAWAARVASAPLPGYVSTAVELNSTTGLMTLAISWTGKDSSETRTLRTVTDVRP